ncbi:hypothetical protein FBU30_001856 [Linnemannia zychae]|nr:hypothetical protein FBU30_001856 [Linnemannia zychae]
MTEFSIVSCSVNESGEAFIAVDPNSPLNRKRRTKIDMVNDEGARRLAVFSIMVKEKLSLSEFLCAVFTSQQELIKSKARQFYATNGPVRLLRLWRRYLEGTDNDMSLTEKAIKLVGERVEEDLRNTVRVKELRHPANNISYKTINRFSLERLRYSFE